MVVITRFLDKSDNSYQVVVVLGSGLVGSSIINYLAYRSQISLDYKPTNWLIPSRQFMEHLRSIVINLKVDSIERFDWVWAAGKIGFSATLSQASEEMAFFRAFLKIIDESCVLIKASNVYLHLISSAGGLFEGQRYVDFITTPKPHRPYGKLKFKQELLACKYFGLRNVYIYRLSSVYGFINPNYRSGLISTLISNTLSQKTTFFNGHFDTLRDYVWVDDIGNFIANRILTDSHNERGSPYLLASGRPTSIFEIRELVQCATHRRAYIHCMVDMTNAEPITFMPTALPNDWHTSDLVTNIRRIVIDFLCRGAVY